MDRDAIERRDFPVGRRGYDPAAVDAHLREVADQLEALRDRPPPAAAPASLSAGTSEHVRSILEAAEASATELRADAGRQASGHVARVEQATGGMLEQLDRLESELATLLESLRRSGEQLNDGLARLHQQVGGAAPAAEPPADEPPAPEREPEPEPAAVDGDDAGARLIALNMALSGTPREETARYLAEHFALPDAEALLDDVYSRAGQ